MAVIDHPYKPSPDSRIVYVSETSGSDNFSGLQIESPKRTIAAGVALLRDGYPDWLCLKAGDVFNTGFGDWKRNGRSALEPMVITSYGGTTRPILRTGTSPGLQTQNSSGTPSLLHSLVFLGLDFVAHTRKQGSPTYTGPAGSIGIRWLRPCRDITIDNCRIDSYVSGIVAQNYENKEFKNFHIRYCVVVDSYNTGGHSQGIFASGVDVLIIEDCVFDKNGYGDLPTADDDPTIYNHNLYLQYTNAPNAIVRRNVISRAASHAVQMRNGGLMEDNFVYRNPIGLQTGSTEHPLPEAEYAVRNNVVLEAGDITPSLPRGWGINFATPAKVLVQGNIVAHVKSSSTNRRSIENKDYVTYKDNIVYDWSVVPGKGYGENFNSPGPFVSPHRSILSYGFDGDAFFFNMLRSQSRQNWNSQLSATELNQYFRDGFKPLTPGPIPAPTPPPPPPVSEKHLVEEIYPVKDQDGDPQGPLGRISVPGGWLVSNSFGVAFLPDPNHEWTI